MSEMSYQDWRKKEAKAVSKMKIKFGGILNDDLVTPIIQNRETLLMDQLLSAGNTIQKLHKFFLYPWLPPRLLHSHADSLTRSNRKPMKLLPLTLRKVLH